LESFGCLWKLYDLESIPINSFTPMLVILTPILVAFDLSCLHVYTRLPTFYIAYITYIYNIYILYIYNPVVEHAETELTDDLWYCLTALCSACYSIL
jgi:hypothetical protein